MKLNILVTSLLVAAVAAQDMGWIGKLPECPRNCIYSNLAIGTAACGVDAKCLCQNEPYQTALLDCSNSKCTPDETKQLRDGGEEFCRQAGVTIVDVEAPTVVVPIPSLPTFNVPTLDPISTQLPSIPLPSVGFTSVEIPVPSMPTLPTLPMPSIPNPEVTFPGFTAPDAPTPVPAPGNVPEAGSEDKSSTEPSVSILPTNVSAPVYPMPSFTPMPYEGGANIVASAHVCAIAIGFLALVL